ncbi:DNA polymerase III subunit delta' [Desulfoscipio geothermicus]|uniref:DNA polymerase III subunit delta' n=1 Tax=Desulfoscipio geothermicus DSM 3669 TaxID=1121426 RepID=A0A1I6DFP3_9FIRM|nr:DNA polymerase III subunit delta' [Desulfoscipio geothermicus]SFR04217.1 DNA polymerase-3 subunit delta' [Desulfoscipio geothermicus DSM 3669]
MPTLRDVVGHEKIKERLAAALAGDRLSHAYLFGGPAGVGKKTTGLAFARALLCSHGDNDACGVCGDCTRSARGVHPDLHVIRPDGAFIKIHQLRSVQDGAAVTPFGGDRQVYLVERAEKMTLEAANAFLKVLEEPPAGVIFILVSDDPAAILPTVLSRCQRYRFMRLSEEEVLRVVARETGGITEQVRAAARLSGGCPGLALELLDRMGRRDRMRELLMRLVRQRPASTLLPLDEFSGRADLEEFFNYLILLFRDVMVRQKAGGDDLLVNIDCRRDVDELARTYAAEEVLDILITAENASRKLAANTNQRLLLDTVLFKIAGF